MSMPEQPQVDLREQEFSDVTELLQVLRHASERAESALARRLDMSVSDLRAMEHLMQDGDLGPAELARRLDITTASATALVDRLEARGHVSRHAVAGDRRRRAVATTASGQHAAFAELGPLVFALDHASAGLDAEQRATVAAYLRRVVDAYTAFAADD